jgi:hypothetical protein
MSDDLEDFYVHTVTVQTLLGSGGMGSSYAELLILSPDTDNGVFADDKRKLVRSASGAEVVSETTVFGRPSLATILTEGSLVTLPSGRVATVIIASTLTAGDLDLPDHHVAALT